MIVLSAVLLIAQPFAGAAMGNDGLYTWGPKGVYHEGKLQRKGGFTDGGCWTPTFGLVLEEARTHRLVSLKSGLIDTNVHLADCLETTLFGRKGILLIHRNAQVRFYEPGEPPRWPYREIYSIYTPSAQTGLLVEDIDGDGRLDVYCGNYWIQSPEEFDLGWRLYAIHPHYKQPLSSSFRLAKAFGGLVAAQWRFADSPVFSLFRKPSADPTQLWDEQPLAAKPKRPRALLAVDSAIVVGEDMGGDSRILLVRGVGEPAVEIARPGAGVLHLFARDGRLIAVTRSAIRAYSLPRVQ